MLTIEKLDRFGANTEDGLRRCMNITDFYLDLVKSTLDDQQIGQLENALLKNDLGQAFETAHALKGVFANLSLTPLLDPISEMTELLRSRTQTDYSQLMDRVRTAYNDLKALAEE